MKPILIALALVVAGLASAQAQAPRHIDGWLKSVLDNRADKAWRPLLYAGPALAKRLGTVGGITVTADAKVEPGRIEIRTATAVVNSRGETIAKAGEVVASYSGGN